MHTDIKKFWDSLNRTCRMGDRSPEYYTWYMRVDFDPFGQIIAHEWKDGSHTIYFFRDAELSEKDMLIIIGLKAFL